MSNGIVGSIGAEMDLLGGSDGSSTKSGPEIHMADIDDPEFTITYGDSPGSTGSTGSPSSSGSALDAGPQQYDGTIEVVKAREHVQSVVQGAMTTSGRVAAAGAAIMVGAGLVYLGTKPKGKRKRKTMTRGQKIGRAGLTIGKVTLALGGAAYLASHVIKNRINGCKATALFC